MAKVIVYESSLSPYIQGLLDEKRSCGYKYEQQGILLKYFDDYWVKTGYQDIHLTIENLEGWLRQRKSENKGSLRNRICVVIELAKYLNGLGIKSYIPAVEASYEVPIRHILSKSELTEFFYYVDSYRPKYPCNEEFMRMADEYPFLFRLIYHEGMRIRETCTLPLSQINLEKGIITIIDGKGNKDRIIYLADDMAALCREYVGYLTRTLKKEPKWLFPGEDSEEHIGISTVTAMFNSCWSKTSSAATCIKKPTVHDLRHTFVTNRINLWAEQGLSFDVMLPYLAEHLSHKTFNETFYYYHNSQEAYKIIREKDKTSKDVIPEVCRR